MLRSFIFSPRLAVSFLLLCLLPPGMCVAQERQRNITNNLASFLEVVRPMRHPLEGRMPLLVWELPLGRDTDFIWARPSGALRKAVDELASRGIVPLVNPPGDGALAMAKTLQEAGQPIYLSSGRVDQLRATAWSNCPIWVNESDGGHTIAVPCLALADRAAAARWVEQRVRPLSDAKIKVAGAFFDDEGLPQFSQPLFDAQRSTAQCKAQFPPGVLDDADHFFAYVLHLRADLIEAAMCEPIHQLFAGSVVANFSEYSSSKESPFVDADGHAIPPIRCGGDAVTPVLYGRFTSVDRGFTQSQVDQLQFAALLANLSRAVPSARQYHQQIIAYAGQRVAPAPLAKGPWMTMSNAAWRELQWHIWMRGVNGIILLNNGPSRPGASMRDSYEMVENARAVYDELLGYRDILNGQPMNETPPEAGQPVWSGLRTADQCLIRAVCFSPSPKSIQVQTFGTQTITLEATAQGATYLVSKGGDVRAVR